MSSIQLTQPLALGFLLDGAYTIRAGTASVPITGQSANLLTSSAGADVGTSFPLALGLLVGTAGSTGFTITAGTGSVPIATQAATLTLSADPGDSATTFPLALGLLLTNQSYTLPADSFTVALNFAPSESAEFVGGEPPSDATGGWFPNVRVKSRKEVRQERIDLGILPPDPVEVVVEAVQAIPHRPRDPDKPRRTIRLEDLIGKRAAAQVVQQADTKDRDEIAAEVERESRRRKRQREEEILLLMD